MPIRLLGLKAVQRTQLSQRLAAASAASLALGSFPFHRGRAQAVRGEEPARGSPAALEPGAARHHQPGQRHLHHADEQGSTCLIPKSQSGGPGDAVCM